MSRELKIQAFDDKRAVLKKRLKQEGANELITNCKQLKLPAADRHCHQGMER